MRAGGRIPVAKVVPLLDDPDRWVRYAARIAVEHADPVSIRDLLLAAVTDRARLQGMLALVRGRKLDQSAQDDLLAREIAMFGEARGEDRLDLLRLVGLTYLLGTRKVEEASATAVLGKLLLASYPSDDWRITRETARLLAFLDAPGTSMRS